MIAALLCAWRRLLRRLDESAAERERRRLAEEWPEYLVRRMLRREACSYSREGRRFWVEMKGKQLKAELAQLLARRGA
jgi:hypothetical protein